MNKLDLIFEKQPPEVQRKLMNLLIQYNTMMQYNQKQDKFQVDLLLPFETSKQKQQFIQKFNSRTQRRNNSNRNNPDQSSLTKKGPSRKASYQSGQQNNMVLTQFNRNYQSDGHGLLSEYERDHHHLNREDQQEISLDFTNENQLSRRRNTVNIKNVSSVIKDKLRQAVQQIKQDAVNQQPSNQVQANKSDSLHNKDSSYDPQNYRDGSINLKKVQMDQHQNGNMILQKLEEEQNAIHPQYLEVRDRSINNKNDTSNYSQKSTSRKQRKSEQKYQNYSEQSSQIKNQILIEQQQQQKHQNHEDSGRQFQSHSSIYKERPNEMSEQYPYIIQQGYEDEDQSGSSKNRNKPKQKKEQLYTFQNFKSREQTQQRKKSPEVARSVKQKLINKYKVNKKSTPSNIRQKYSQFLNKNYRDFDRLYENIRKDIKRNRTQLNKSRRQDPILVLQQNISDVYSEQDRIFKQQIIKDYQKHIIVQNQNLSSEDLVRYFRYLLQHAKSLYVKNLFKPK